jgi:DNA topoisomerase IB
MVYYYFPLTEEQKKEFESIVPKNLQESPFVQRMYYVDPEMFKRLWEKSEQKMKEALER